MQPMIDGSARRDAQDVATRIWLLARDQKLCLKTVGIKALPSDGYRSPSMNGASLDARLLDACYRGDHAALHNHSLLARIGNDGRLCSTSRQHQHEREES